MAAKIDLVNRALRLLGKRPIEAFDESDAAETADVTYDQARNALLLSNPWSWTERRVPLVATPLASPPGEPARTDNPESYQREVRRGQYPFEFLNPSLTSVIKALYRTSTDSIEDPIDWARRGDFIYSDYSAPVAVVGEIQAEPSFTPLFEDALVFDVAARLAISVTEDEGKARTMAQFAAQTLKTAQRVDSQSQPAERIRVFPHRDVRLGSRYDFRRRFGIEP